MFKLLIIYALLNILLPTNTLTLEVNKEETDNVYGNLFPNLASFIKSYYYQDLVLDLTFLIIKTLY